MEGTTPADLYRDDLQALEEAMDERDEREAAENASLAASRGVRATTLARGRARPRQVAVVGVGQIGVCIAVCFFAARQHCLQNDPARWSEAGFY